MESLLAETLIRQRESVEDLLDALCRRRERRQRRQVDRVQLARAAPAPARARVLFIPREIDPTRRCPMRSCAAHGLVRYGTRARRMKLGAGVEARHRDRRRQWMDRCRRPRGEPWGVMGTIGY